MHAWQFAKALFVADAHNWTRFVSMQNHYNLLYREEEREMLGLCAAEGIGVLPWSLLGRGRLASPWSSAVTPRTEGDSFGNSMYQRTESADKAVVDSLESLAAARAIPQAQLALAWLLARLPVTSPIVGPTKPHHLDDAVAALNVNRAPQETAAREAPYIPHPVLGFG
jgi:aryl-alcohol dehydrogenase-like predicted oxidoreductase